MSSITHDWSSDPQQPVLGADHETSIRIAVAVAVRPNTPQISVGDQAALEAAMVAAETWRAAGTPTSVVGYCVAPVSAEPVLADLVALGLDRMVLCLESGDAELADSGAGVLNQAEVADALAVAVIRDRVDLVFCGDTGMTVASGAVPSMMAARLGVASIRGLVEVEPREPGVLSAVVRLDRGARERVLLRAPVVASVEGSAGTLRRASLRMLLAARHRPIEIVDRPGDARSARPLSLVPSVAGAPTRIVPPPTGSALERTAALSGVTAHTSNAQVLELDPPGAAERIVEQLLSWGYPVGSPGTDGST